MNFISWQFLALVAAAWLAYWSQSGNLRRKWLLVFGSYGFYAFWDYRFLPLMLVVTLNAYLGGRFFGTAAGAGARRLALTVSIFFYLGLLFFFKYAGFVEHNIALAARALGLAPLAEHRILLPIGISFYTFHGISYSVDVYKRKVPVDRHFVDIALYIAFFPQLIAGPISRSSFFLPQLQRARRWDPRQQLGGLRQFLLGFVYKAALADNLATLLDPVFTAPAQYTGDALLAADFAFYGQIYFDFAGYSAMAIGTARLFGYRLPKNFNFPYAARSLTEFWRRWHMSLSFWLRDYLYVPLGGSRAGTLLLYRNLMLTMVLGGLWHGANWTFVLWGFLHGLGLCAHKLWQTAGRRLGMLGRLQRTTAWRPAAWLLTQAYVLVAWVVFRAASVDDAVDMLGILAGRPGGGYGIALTPWVVVALVGLEHTIGLAGLWRWRPHRPVTAAILFWAGFGLVLGLALAAMPFIEKPFIYFQF